MLSLISDKKTQFKEAFSEIKRLLENGWCQHHYVNYSGDFTNLKEEYCLVGAINHISSRNMVFSSDLINKFVEANNLTIVKRNFTVTAWNDTPGRTKEEVLAALDKAIKYVG